MEAIILREAGPLALIEPAFTARLKACPTAPGSGVNVRLGGRRCLALVRAVGGLSGGGRIQEKHMMCFLIIVAE